MEKHNVAELYYFAFFVIGAQTAAMTFWGW